MTTKRRMDYRVDEDALKRMMAGDVTALEETVPHGWGGLTIMAEGKTHNLHDSRQDIMGAK